MVADAVSSLTHRVSVILAEIPSFDEGYSRLPSR
jgi:hypothetical protein